MIIVAGFFRTGTSIMTRCLGAEVSTTGKLMEYAPFRICNAYILKKNGCLLTPKGLTYYNKPSRLRNYSNSDFFKAFWEQVEIEKPIAIKDPQIQLTIEIWKEFPLFADGKFLVPTRDRENCLQSFMKKKGIIRITSEKILDEYTDNFMHHITDLNCCFYEFEKFIQKDKKTIERIEDFIEEKLNLDYINLNLWHFT